MANNDVEREDDEMRPYYDFSNGVKNPYAARKLSDRACSDLRWWRDVLSLPNVSRSLLPRTHASTDVWVDASTDFGIGILIDGRWSMWRHVHSEHDGNGD